MDSARPVGGRTYVGTDVPERFDLQQRPLVPRNPLCDLPPLSGSGQKPNIGGYAIVAAGVVRRDKRPRAIWIERDSGDPEHSPRAGILVDESDPERITRLTGIERFTALSERRNRIERKRRDHGAISRYCVEGRVEGAQDRESLDEGGIDGAAVRGDLAW